MVNIFWFRRDLRLDDNTGLDHALRSGIPVIPIFIFDKNILDQLDDKRDKRVVFIYHALEEIQAQLKAMGSTLEVYYGHPEDIFKQLIEKYQIKEVYTNHDYEPYAITRDNMIRDLLKGRGTELQTFKDQVIFERNDVVKDDGRPYTVFTPYSRKWKSLFNASIETHSLPVPHNFYKQPPYPLPSLESMGFKAFDIVVPSIMIDEKIIEAYEQTRDHPALNGTSKLGIHLRFGTISIRKLVTIAERREKFLNELIWREFYQMILWHFPYVVERAFKPAYDNIEWRNNEAEFERWCNATTGYPIVDAGMRELNSTGFMHNRVRMIVASFLCKHLLIDWRWGEAYFASKLLDYELASNNGGWQWASGSGCDPAPYFRIFNPYLQTEKFDRDRVYIRKWVPEFENIDYPEPIVDHESARKRALEVYSKAVKSQ